MQRSKVDQLPKDVRDWLDATLIEGNFSGYTALEKELRGRGYDISRSGAQRYGSKLEKSLAAVRDTTRVMQMMNDMGVDLRDARSGGLIALIQSDLFSALMEMQGDDSMEPAKRAALLSQIGKNVAALARSSVEVKQHQKEADAEKTAAQESGSNGQGGVIEICLVDPPSREITENDAVAPETTEGLQ